MNKEVDLSISCYGKVKDRKYDIVVLPWGATEPHNLHLPYMTDCILSHDVAVDAALIAKQEYGVNCMVMPPIGMGSQNPGQRELPFCIHTRYETQKAILTDIVSSLYAQGIRKLVIINGHGGNTFKSMIRDLSVDYPDFLIASSEWYTVLKVKDFGDCFGIDICLDCLHILTLGKRRHIEALYIFRAPQADDIDRLRICA